MDAPFARSRTAGFHKRFSESVPNSSRRWRRGRKYLQVLSNGYWFARNLTRKLMVDLLRVEMLRAFSAADIGAGLVAHRRHCRRYKSGALNVSPWRISPVSEPRRKQRARSSEVRCVNESGTT